MLSQQAILPILGETGYPILSEESADTVARLKSDRVWIIDPLDGTQDFIDQTDEFSVLIALVENQQPILGVIYQPTAGLLLLAQQGQGAYMNDSAGNWKKISVSAVADLASARPIMSRNHFRPEDKKFLDFAGVKNFSHSGSAGLKIALTASGQADFYLADTDKIKQWDTAAACCVIKEAGGRMTDLSGQDFCTMLQI